jgi:pectate lyase
MSICAHTRGISLTISLILLLGLAQQATAFENTPIGYASLAGDPCVPATYLAGGTTGGAGGTLVTVTTAAQFGTYAREDTPYIIQVQGDIGDVGQINMHSNKTIIGIGPNPTIRGNLVVSGTSNFIIRNLIVRNDAGGSSADGIAVRDGGHHVWIDHVEVFNVPDGLCDVTKEADYVTVSWSRFYYTPDWTNIHRYACLMGASDSDTTDLGRLHVTWHHNWWGDNVIERMPSVRYGRVHIFNNYYTSTGNNYCVRYRVASEVIVEKNYFKNVNDPHVLYISGEEPAGYPQGLCYAFGNIYDNTTGTYTSTGPLTLPSYTWTPDNAVDVPAIVMAGSGVNKLSGGDTTAPTPNPMTFATAPYAISSSAITMVATTATDANSVQYYFQCTTTGGHDSGWQAGTTYTDTGLAASTAYIYQVKARDLSPFLNETAYSNPASATTQVFIDTTPPAPNPMTFATPPYGDSTSSISMGATTATDNANGVEYYFANTTLVGHDSGWQVGTTYTDSGLALGTSYSYKVKARDTSPAKNETAYSGEVSASTLAANDTTPPTPDPMTFATTPHAVSPTSIAMTATTATDASGVQYFFHCLTPGGHDSGWLDSTAYTDYGLLPQSAYSYEVKARDKSAGHNETAYSVGVSATTMPQNAAFENSPIGWASYNDLGFNGTTGGAGGATYVAKTAAQFIQYAESTTAGPAIVKVVGTIDLAGTRVDISSNKTIVGDTNSTNPPIVRGGTLRIRSNLTEPADPEVHNIIIRNIKIADVPSGGDGDGIAIQYGAHHIWVDHCDFTNCYDGALDITHGCDYVTVSWNHFYAHSKTCLLGHDNGNAAEDTGHLKVTYHHNWFDSTDERHPRVRFSYLTHVFNNYYIAKPSWPENYAVASTCDAYVLLEGNYFQDYVKQYVYSASGYLTYSPAGYLCERYNMSVNCVANGLETNCPASPLEASTFYSYTLDPAANVPTIVTAGSGFNKLVDDKTAPLPNPMTFATPPIGITMSSITMVATAASDDSGVEYYFHCLTVGGHDSGWQDSTTYTDTELVGSTTYTYQVKARDKSNNHNETAYSSPASATTQVFNDNAAPTPDPMAWASVPAIVSGTYSSITMTAATATDVSGVEYYFANLTDASHDSGWQNGTTYVDTGLANNTLYVYTVKARDKSINYNQTASSVTASATTPQFICSGSILGDINHDCRCNFADYAPFAGALGAWVPFQNLIINGAFDADISSWLFTNASGAVGTMTYAWDGTNGQPVGSALFTANTTGTNVNHHRFYQVFPVTVGKQYRISGQWKGALYDPNAGTRRNWAEVFVFFSTTTTPSTWSPICYKKRFISTGSTSNINFAPSSNGTWNWEFITDSPNSEVSPLPPETGIYTATQPYMVVAFNLGGNSNGGSIRLNVDNLKVVEYTCPSIDLTGDCNLDYKDFAQFAADWLRCNRTPSGECWQ